MRFLIIILLVSTSVLGGEQNLKEPCNGDWWNYFLSILLPALLQLATAVIAIIAIDAWKKEHVGRKRHDLAEDTLALFYAAQSAIKSIRSPIAFGGEGQTREKDDDETDDESRRRDKAFRYGQSTNRLVFCDCRGRRTRQTISRLNARRFLPFSPLRPEKGFFCFIAPARRQGIKKPPTGWHPAPVNAKEPQMSASTVSHPARIVNRRHRKFDRFENPTIETIPDLWLESDRPKVIFADAVSASESCLSVGATAKLLSQNGIEIGQNRFFKWLRANNFLMLSDGTNVPTQRALDMGLFKVIERAITVPSGENRLVLTTKVTAKGQQYFINKFLEMETVA